MWIKNSFVQILLTSANVDKGGGVGRLYTKCGKFASFFNPSLNELITDDKKNNVTQSENCRWNTTF